MSFLNFYFLSYKSHKFGISTFELSLIFEFETSGILKFYCLKFNSPSIHFVPKFKLQAMEQDFRLFLVVHLAPRLSSKLFYGSIDSLWVVHLTPRLKLQAPRSLYRVKMKVKFKGKKHLCLKAALLLELAPVLPAGLTLHNHCGTLTY